MARMHAPHRLIVIVSASFAQIAQQFGDSLLADASHAGDGADTVSFNYHSDDLCSLRCAQAVHNETHYA